MARYQGGFTWAAGLVLAAFVISTAAGVAQGQTSNYIPNDLGNWTDPDSWDNGVPNGIGANAVLNQPVSSQPNASTNNVISLNLATVTLGSLTSNNDTTPAPNTRYMRTEFASGAFVFETASGPATLNENLGASTELENRMRINVPVQLNSSLVVNSNHALNRNTNTEFVQLVSGSANKTITKEGSGNLQMAFTGGLAENEGFFGNLIINNGGVRMITSNTTFNPLTEPNPNPANTQLSKSAGVLVVAGGQLQLGNRMPSFALGPNAELKLNGTGKVAPATTTQNDGALRFEIQANSGVTCTFDSPVNLQTKSHIHVNATGTTGVLTKEVRGAGELRKTGSGALALNFANTYTGGTSVSSGELRASGANAKFGTGNVSVEGTTNGAFLSIESGVLNAIGNSATLSLAGGGTAGTADRGYVNLGDGINETIAGLILNGAAMAPGTYGSTTSGAPAANQFNEFFAGTGVVTVSASFLAADFNNSTLVDSNDLTLWNGGFGNFTGQAKINGDANDDHGVDGSDFLVWQQQFGTGSGATANAAAIPEPAGALLALLAAPLTTLVRRKR